MYLWILLSGTDNKPTVKMISSYDHPDVNVIDRGNV